jgi:hypothetical protein
VGDAFLIHRQRSSGLLADQGKLRIPAMHGEAVAVVVENGE